MQNDLKAEIGAILEKLAASDGNKSHHGWSAALAGVGGLGLASALDSTISDEVAHKNWMAEYKRKADLHNAEAEKILRDVNALTEYSKRVGTKGGKIIPKSAEELQARKLIDLQDKLRKSQGRGWTTEEFRAADDLVNRLKGNKEIRDKLKTAIDEAHLAKRRQFRAEAHSSSAGLTGGIVGSAMSAGLGYDAGRRGKDFSFGGTFARALPAATVGALTALGAGRPTGKSLAYGGLGGLGIGAFASEAGRHLGRYAHPEAGEKKASLSLLSGLARYGW